MVETTTNIEQAVKPFKIQQLAEIIMEKKYVGFADALHYLYSSDFYPRLFSADTKWWYSSGYELFDIIDKEKSSQRKLLKNRKITLFFIFSIESFADFIHESSETILSLFTTKHVFDFLQENFDTLHTQSKEFIVDTIDDYIKSGSQQ
ncbi:MAG: DUF3791 domain-containing protein [Tannerella sp.]|jgi:hypothetical protein|nr:DUF3791 domain-containing protein [Tannerella sp.]